MFAIYKPAASNTRTAGVVRDITRLIVENSTANLEFHDSNTTQIIDNTASGWSLATGQALSTDVTPGINDTDYILQCNSRIGSNKKYAAIMMSGQLTSSTFYNGTMDNQTGIVLSSVVDFNAGTQDFAFGYNSTTTSYTREASIMNFGHAYYNSIIIIAKPDLLLIQGSTYSGRSVCYMVIEFADNAATQKYRSTYSSSVPVANVSWHGNGYNSSNISFYYSRYYGDNNAYQSTVPNQVLFSQCLADIHNNEYYRSYVVGYKYASDPVQDGQMAGATGMVENGTQIGTASTTWPFNTNNLANQMTATYQWAHSLWSHDHHWQNIRTFSQFRKFGKDVNGNNILPLYPIVQSLDFMNPGIVVNLSEYSGVYKTVLDLPFSTGDTLTINGEIYMYVSKNNFLGINTTANSYLSYLVKVN